MNYLQKLYIGRIGGLAFFVGSIVEYITAWIIQQLGKIVPNNVSNTIELLFIIPVVLFTFSVFSRRLHDLGKSGWLSLLMFIPLVNLIMVVILLFKPGNHEANKFGEPPRDRKYLLNDLFAV